MHTLAYGLQNFYVYCGCAAVVAIIFEFIIAYNSVCALPDCKVEGGVSRDPGHDGSGIEREYRWIGADVVRVKDLREFQRREDGIWQV